MTQSDKTRPAFLDQVESRRLEFKEAFPVFKELKLIEAWGSGIRKMHDELTDYPEIELVLQEAGQTFQVQFVKKDSIPRPESLRDRVLGCIVSVALSKAEISAVLGQKEISGQLNKIVRKLLTEGYIEYTIPEKPNSRLQKYRLTEKGESWRQ